MHKAELVEDHKAEDTLTILTWFAHFVGNKDIKLKLVTSNMDSHQALCFVTNEHLQTTLQQKEMIKMDNMRMHLLSRTSHP